MPGIEPSPFHLPGRHHWLPHHLAQGFSYDPKSRPLGMCLSWKYHNIKNIMKNPKNVSLPLTMIHSSYQCFHLAGCFTTSITKRNFEKYQNQIVISWIYLPLLSVDSVIFWYITKYIVKTWSRCGVFIFLWYKAPSRSWN